MTGGNPQETRFARPNLLMTFEEMDRETEVGENSTWTDINKIPDDTIVHFDFNASFDIQKDVVKIAKINTIPLVNGKTERELFDDYFFKKSVSKSNVDFDKIIISSVNRYKKKSAYFFSNQFIENGNSKILKRTDDWNYHQTHDMKMKGVEAKGKIAPKTLRAKPRGKMRQSEWRKMAQKLNHFLQISA